jgi:hypothetical protein
MEKLTHLSEEDMLLLELNIERTNVAREKVKTLRAEDHVRQLECQILKLKGDVCYLQAKDIEIPQVKSIRAMELANTQLRTLEDERKNIIESIRTKYDIKDPGFGFNPETGEIIEGDVPQKNALEEAIQEELDE